MKFYELVNKFYQHNKEKSIKRQFEDNKPLIGKVVVSNKSFDKEYPLESRTYTFRSDNKYFISEMLGKSIYASSIDGSDDNVRLDWYLNEWTFEEVEIVEE